MIIPGPKQPKDTNSFLYPLVQELRKLEVGIHQVYDAHQNKNFILRGALVGGVADQRAMVKFIGMKGPNGKRGCRMCLLLGK